jgi:2-keto-4-pentenoate hydratase
MTGGCAVAQRFVEARRAGSALDTFPGPIPRTLSEAYAIQDAAITLWRQETRGWKVGRIAPPYDTEHAADRLAGPIFRVAGDGATMGVFADGFAAVEAELILRIGCALSPPPALLQERVVGDLIDAAFVGIEVASSPLPAINDLGPTVTIADFGNNQGLVVGEEIPSWRGALLADWPVALAIDDQEVGAATVASIPGGPLAAVRFLLQTLGRRGVAVAAGTLVSTGAITGVHPVRPGQSVTAMFGHALKVGCRISAL